MTTLQDKFADARACMNAALIERHDEIDLVLTGLLCNEHPLLVGPPGTGKSLLIDTLMSWIDGNAKQFGILLGKYSVPDEMFGPLNVKDLKDGKFNRVTDGMLPEAHLAFIDEIFKASSAILNSMLKVLNERRFKQGANEVTCPLRIALAASNEWPEAKELGALFDRFILRKTVKQVSRLGRRRLMRERHHAAKFASKITLEELSKANAEAMALEFTETSYDAFDEILDELAKEGISPGDRRLKKSMNICRAYAYLKGASEVEVEHLEVLKWVLWDDPTEQETKCHKVVGKIANPVGTQITDLLMQASSVTEQCSKPEEAVTKLQDINDKLEEVPEHDRKQAAIAYVKKELKRNYERVIRV